MNNLHKSPMLNPIYTKACLIFGCGNPLLGDDGFGPAVIAHLENHYQLPEHAAILDVGTSIREILFDMLLSDSKPQQMVIVDAAQHPQVEPGTISEINIDQIQLSKISDYSLHQFPTTNMLKELKEETEIDIRVLVAQMSCQPTEVKPGLSQPVKDAVPRMCERILNVLLPTNNHPANIPSAITRKPL